MLDTRPISILEQPLKFEACVLDVMPTSLCQRAPNPLSPPTVTTRTHLPPVLNAPLKGWLRESIEDHSPKHTLANLARICHTWSDIALDHLWYDIDGIEPLVKCMPPDLWKRDGPIMMSFIRPITTSDLEILTKYAGRVRVLRPSMPSSRAHISVYQALSAVSSDNCLLPNLRQLVWEAADAEEFGFIRLFLNPGLDSLTLRLFESQHDQIDLLSKIPTTFTRNISSLQVSYGLGELGCDPLGLSSVVLNWSQLVDLQIPDITPYGLRTLAQMPNLQCLSFTALASLWTPLSQEEIRNQAFDADESITTPFPSMTRLELTTWVLGIEPITKLLRFIRRTSFIPFLSPLALT
ncbi:hypothetical protein NP233_g2388 [Leucocoprinus birnbaumii]|uniref:F-box domain-containing protein n=1 Tax=Leucocoprinus birnbaumii TaxID=56174 RepID=A0AAD5VYZ2_9AGAR|nr:hypothetical protein NP233_g2388 [Leucocoprinus birnbaumii]